MITFPATPETFTAYQEQLVGRELDKTEKELIEALVSVFNDSHTAGQHQDRNRLAGILQALDRCRTSNEPAESEFLQACRQWIITAWKQGFHDPEGRSIADGQ